MELGKLVSNINALNKEGIRLADKGRLEKAIIQHEEASELAKNNELLNPDYMAVSEANRAYAIRHLTNDRNKTIGILDDAFELTDLAMEQFPEETYFGRGRLLEEKGLVIRYAPEERNVINDLKTGINTLSKSIDFYKNSINNEEKEIVDSNEINNRLARTTGIVATVYLELSKIDNRPAAHLADGLRYANKELDMRIKNGETKGFGLANAYHTLGVLQTELIGSKEGIEEDARNNIIKASELVPEFSMTGSVLSFRKAWIDYKMNPENTEPLVDSLFKVVNDQKNTLTKWSSAVKEAHKDRILEIANHVADKTVKEVKDRIDEMYSN